MRLYVYARRDDHGSRKVGAMTMTRIVPVFLLAAMLVGCTSHSVGCAIGSAHANCLPGTTGYRDPNMFAAVDDQQCRSFGMLPGSTPYANCRATLNKQHQAGLTN